MRIALKLPADGYFSLTVCPAERLRNADGKAGIYTDEQELQIHDDGDCCNAVLTRKGERGAVEYGGRDGNGELVDKL